MPSVGYFYARALELEGRHPLDAGSWQLTVNRLEVGEGSPRSDTRWARIEFAEGESFPRTNFPPTDVLYRNFYYRRIRSAEECARHLFLNPAGPIRVSFHLTADWKEPPNGLIPLPSESDRVLPHTHSAVIFERLPSQRLLRFRVKWPGWGDRSTGYMPYEYFDRYAFECWAIYGEPEALRVYRFSELEGKSRIRWSAHDEFDHRIYAFEVRDSAGRERIAWTFVIERDGALEIEELYVRPEHRRLGYGRWLADRVVQLGHEKKLALRLRCAFADCKSENESNYVALVATARRMRLSFQPCPVPWAAYYAISDQPGEELPVEPAFIPQRPRTPYKDLLAAAALALSPAYESNGQIHKSTAAATSLQSQRVLSIGSSEWNDMNERRSFLIDKKYDPGEGLTLREQSELDDLQKLGRETVERTYPRPKLSPREATIIERALGTASE